LYTIFFLSCIVLVAVVLLQPGKTDAGALFTSNISSNAFGPRGTATVLSKITIAAAAIFMLSALLISMPALSGGTSVLSSVPETPSEAPAAANTNSTTVEVQPVDANANSNVGTVADNSNSVSNTNAATPANK
jgi:preprotein translocase subunit SecG